ncbi:chloride channel protein [Idiomarina sp. OT37-5b]|jgi:H+/Cl- antiporter ClcA|uniref:Chloride channel protein n=1 Tax=Idiomarina aquatica TaxID=1327752 RepID=A0AA94EED8_9GAMM|nr:MULTISPECIES: chloride channel protein [Idiomarina]AVJ56888.1 chloride channel protein [Idiomarina sp. OT37-5b]RUO42376.1 chloride channel protein [Idiomarina aquatica]
MTRVQALKKSLRKQLAAPTTTIAICLLGLLGGIAAALVIVVFRFAIEQGAYVVGNVSHWQQPLSNFTRFALPIGAALLIFLLFSLSRSRRVRMGIPYVIHRMKQHYGMLPWQSTVNQFFGGIIALVAGFSVGREGPAVHLGAAASTWVGYHVDTPKNAIRTLAACGIAAAIAASFNTPIAAMVLVMEVVLREYKVHIFIPVMLAAVAGSLITEQIFGPAAELAMLSGTDLPNIQLPWVVILGVILGISGVIFKKLMLDVMNTVKDMSLLTRLLFAAFITSLLALIIPSSLGPGLTAIQQVVQHQQELSLLFTLLLAKLVASAIALGMGIPGGLIGAVFGIGAVVAALFTGLVNQFELQQLLQYDTFILLGMAGILAACIHAPMAALLAIVELSRSVEIIIPAMLVIVPAYLISSQLFNSKSIFIAQLDAQELPYQIPPVAVALQKTGVEHVMETDFKLLLEPTQNELLDVLENASNQTVVVMNVDEDNQPVYRLVTYDIGAGDSPSLNYMPINGLKVTSTLAEVWDELSGARRGAVYVYDQEQGEPCGIVTWEIVRKALQRELS